MIDHIGTKRISIRQVDGGIAITPLGGGISLKLSESEWFDLCEIVTAITRAVDFTDAYSPDEVKP